METRSRLLILDFDGTMTDAEAEGAPFREGYLEDLAALTERALPWIREAAARYEAVVASESAAYGWVFGGRIVAPASVDPYLRMMPVARLISRHACMMSSPWFSWPTTPASSSLRIRPQGRTPGRIG